MSAKKRLKGIKLSDTPKGISLLAVAVFRLSRSLKSQVAQVVSKDESIGLVTWRILLGLSLVENATQRELVEFTRMEQAQVSRTLREMAGQNLIAFNPSATDGRVRLYELTELGRAKHRQLFPDVARLSDAMDNALSLDERLQFLDMCNRIQQAAMSEAETLTNPIQTTQRPQFKTDPEEVQS